MKVSHYGIAVRKFDDAVKSYIDLGFKQIDNGVNIDKENNIQFIRVKDIQGKVFKIFGINDNSKPSYISKTLEDSNFPAILFYIAMETKNLDGKMLEMINRGYSIIEEKKQEHAFNRRYVMLYKKSVGNIKLLQI